MQTALDVAEKTTKKSDTDAGPLRPADHKRNNSPAWVTVAFVFTILLGGFAAYQGGLDNDFTNWDDNWLITENRHIREISFENIANILNPFAETQIREELGNEYLPMRDFSYMLNYAFDGYNPRGWHALNLLLHLFNSLLVMWLGSRITGRRWVGGIAGILFAVHPVHVEAVSWLSSRKDLLATFFLLLSTQFYLAFRRPREGLMSSQSFVQRVRESRRLSFSLALLMFLFALLSKMPAVVLPALLLVIELFRPRALKTASVGKRTMYLAPFFGIALLFTLLAMQIGQRLMREPYGDGIGQSTMTAVAALARDGQVLFAGYPLYAAVDMPVQDSFGVMLGIGIVVLIATFGIAAFGLYRARGKEWKRPSVFLWGSLGMCASWMAVSLLPVSNFFVRIGTVFAERYLYIPSIGFCIGLACLVVYAFERSEREPVLRAAVRIPVLGVLCALVVLGGVMTHLQTDAWANSRAVWQHTLSHDPENHTALFNLGRTYQEQAHQQSDDERRQQLLEDAIEQYRLALDHPARTYRYDPARVHAAIASVLIEQEKADEALVELDHAVQAVDQPWRQDERSRNDVEALIANFRGLALSRLGRESEAEAAFRTCIEKSNGRYAAARVNLASLLAGRALKSDPLDTDTLNAAYRQLNEYLDSRGRDTVVVGELAHLKYEEFQCRLELSGKGSETNVPDDLQPLLQETQSLHREWLKLLDQTNASNNERASAYVRAAEAYLPGSPGAKKAEVLYRKALKLAPSREGLRFNLARLLFERSDSISRAEGTRLLDDELKRFPDNKAAKSFKATGLMQGAMDRASNLKAKWTEEYASATGDNTPTWEGLVTRFFKRKEFNQEILAITTLMSQALNLDPDREEFHEYCDTVGIVLARGMWFTRDDAMRITAEAFLRNAFNANPVDGPVSRILTQFYLDLADNVIRNSENEDQRRHELNKLLKNMLSLSERARRVISSRLYKTGRNIADGSTQVRDENGKPRPMTETSRKMLAAEFMQASIVLNDKNVEALDWLKHYYEDEGDLRKAVEVFEKLVDVLRDTPELMQGVNLSLAQLQHDLGQQYLVGYKNNLRLAHEERALELREKAIDVFKACLVTAKKVLDAPRDPEKISLPIRLYGVACQRLGYLEAANAKYYYGLAIEQYQRAPLDFEAELAEVRKKRSWFIDDPYKRREELRTALMESPDSADNSEIQQALRNLDMQIARTEAKSLLSKGKPQAALDRINQDFKMASSVQYRTRAEIHLALAKQADEAKDTATMKEHRAAAARDYVRARNDPEALILGGVMFWEDSALIFEDQRDTKARSALERAMQLIDDAMVNMDEEHPRREKYDDLRKRGRKVLASMENLARTKLNVAEKLYSENKLSGALRSVTEALDIMADNGRAWHIRGQIERDLSRRDGRLGKRTDALRWAHAAQDSFLIALRQPLDLSTQRIRIQLDLIDLLIADLGDIKTAKFWLDMALGTLESLPANIESSYRKRYNRLKNRVR